MKKPLILLASALLCGLFGCGEPAPIKDTSESLPRPAPGAPTKDVMVPTATAGGQ